MSTTRSVKNAIKISCFGRAVVDSKSEDVKNMHSKAVSNAKNHSYWPQIDVTLKIVITIPTVVANTVHIITDFLLKDFVTIKFKIVRLSISRLESVPFALMVMDTPVKRNV